MRAAYAFATLIFGAAALPSCTLSAQTAPVTPATVLLAGVPSLNCPIAISARRWAPGGMALAQDRNAEPEGRRLYLHFITGLKSGLVAATVTLHGTDGKARAELTADGTSGPELQETFQLKGDPNAPIRSSSVSLRHLANVRWVAITELRFADGTSWHESADASCHITPNGFRLVDAER